MTDRSREFRLAMTELDAPPAPVAGATSSGADLPPIDIDLAWDALRTVIDPEIGLDIVTLGMVYELTADGSELTVTFTLTTPGCPMEEHITNGIIHAAAAVPGVARVEPNLIWEPRWHAGMIQPGAW